MEPIIYCLKCPEGHTWITQGTPIEGTPDTLFDEATCPKCDNGLITIVWMEP